MIGQSGSDRADMINESMRGRQMAKRKSIWPGEGSACQQTNKHSAWWETSDWGKLIRQARQHPLHHLLCLFMNFTNLLYCFLFCFFCLSGSSSSVFQPLLFSKQPRSPSCRPRRWALTPCSSLRLLLNISIKFCLSGSPYDPPWRAKESLGFAWRAVEWILYTVIYKWRTCLEVTGAWIPDLSLHSCYCGQAPNSIPDIYWE